jgi:transposase
MKPKSSLNKLPVKAPAEAVVKDIRRQTRRHFSAEDKIRIVLDGLRGEDSIAELCRKEGIAQSLYYTWSKEFMCKSMDLIGRTSLIGGGLSD